MWVYKSIQIIYIMYRYTCHGCKCMMMRMCMLTCMHALVYHMHQTTIGFARVCARAHVSAHACIRREGAGSRGQLQRSYVHTRAQTCTCIVRTHSITQRLAHTHTQNTHAAHMYSSMHAHTCMHARVRAFDIHIHLRGGWMKGEMKDRRKGRQAGRERRGGGRGDAERIKACALT